MESRIHREVYVRFGGEFSETYYSDIARRWVLTLLDFIFKYNDIVYNYPTIIFYQLTNNLFTLWQSACRAFRLIQTEECRTYYLFYSGTEQEKIINLMADKKACTAAIQGTFSAEGLMAMANGVDKRVKLAEQLKSDFESLQAKFNKANEVFNQNKVAEDTRVEHRAIISEIAEKIRLETSKVKTSSMTAIEKLIKNSSKSTKLIASTIKEKVVNSIIKKEPIEMDPFARFHNLLNSKSDVPEKTEGTVGKITEKSKKKKSKQLSIFDIVKGDNV